MRKLASVQKILELNPIPNADRILCAKVQGWELVVKKDEFKVGDLCVYIEIDSIVPERQEFEFLRDRKFRVRTIKLKKQISQGLALPLSILPKGNYNEGDDVTELLGVKKYDPEGDKERALVENKMKKSKNPLHKIFGQYKWYRSLFMQGKSKNFPSFITKTDETRLQNMPHILEQEKDTIFSVTEKIDGQSATYFLKKNKRRFKFLGKKYTFGVCSRNIYLYNPNNSSYWTIAKQLHIEDVLKKLIGKEDFIVLQGEITGEGIQGNKYKVEGYDFHAFNLKYPNGQISSGQAKDILSAYDIKFVPILDEQFKLKTSVKEMVDYAKSQKSTLLNVLREGVVIRNNEKKISFKVINPEFLLKNEE